ncbi:MAG: hypothetical protein ACREDL_21270 [Bradyrhizobium sp.]
MNTILARTREGKLSWEELSLTGFLTRVGQTMITIDRPRGDKPPSMRIADESGKIIETIESPVYSDAPQALPIELLSELYELARRQALRVDETLSDLKRSLDRL